MKIVVFGAGQIYVKKRSCFRNDEIVAILDNNSKIQGKELDGIRVYAPEEISGLKYEAICIMAGSVFAIEMKKQLIELGVCEEKIYLSDRDFFAAREQKDVIAFGEKAYINKTVFLLASFQNTGGFRAGLYALKLIKRQNKDVTVVVPCDGEGRKEVESLGVDILITSDISFSNPAFKELILQAERVFVNGLYYGYLMPDMDLPGKKILWWIHSGESFYKTYALPYKAMRLNYIKVYGVSNLVCDAYLKNNSEGEIKIMPYGLPDQCKESANSKEQREHLESKLKLAMVGAVIRIKGVDVLIDAIKQLSEDEQKNIEVNIIGPEVDRKYAEEVHRLAKGIEEIHWIGAQSHEQVMEELPKMDVLVSASREDMLPLVTIEAMMNSCACIISDSIGTAGFVEDGKDALVFHSEDSCALKDKISQCIGDRVKCQEIGKNGRILYEKCFSEDSFAERLQVEF